MLRLVSEAHSDFDVLDLSSSACLNSGDSQHFNLSLNLDQGTGRTEPLESSDEMDELPYDAKSVAEREKAALEARLKAAAAQRETAAKAVAPSTVAPVKEAAKPSTAAPVKEAAKVEAPSQGTESDGDDLDLDIELSDDDKKKGKTLTDEDFDLDLDVELDEADKKKDWDGHHGRH